MKSYSLISIDKKLCCHTDPLLFKALGTCIKCNKIPLPSYRSSQDIKNTYCQKCYEQKKFDPNNLIESLNDEYLIEKLIINCKYLEKGCPERNQFVTIRNLLDHEKFCPYNESRKCALKEKAININELKVNCVKCKDSFVDVANHDCMTTVLKIISEMTLQIKTLTAKYEQEKTEKNKQIDDLSIKFDTSLEKQYGDLINLFKYQIQLNINETNQNHKNLIKEM